jgi:hypothetical protein
VLTLSEPRLQSVLPSALVVQGSQPLEQIIRASAYCSRDLDYQAGSVAYRAQGRYLSTQTHRGLALYIAGIPLRTNPDIRIGWPEVKNSTGIDGLALDESMIPQDVNWITTKARVSLWATVFFYLIRTPLSATRAKSPLLSMMVIAVRTFFSIAGLTSATTYRRSPSSLTVLNR